MVSLIVGQQLKAAGLTWYPSNNDFFSIPYPELSERVFVITDMTVLIELRDGRQMVTFHGTAEWAMDHVLLTEAVWLPREDQVRTQLEQRLMGEAQPLFHLTSTLDGYQCEIHHNGETKQFEAFGASDAYGQALLYVMEQEREG
jgi:hypothetical protein